MRRRGLKAKSVCGRKGIKSARDVVKNLRESLEEDPKDVLPNHMSKTPPKAGSSPLPEEVKSEILNDLKKKFCSS
uniref:Uncharacterized protein n=1 Tax=Populus trichocarpa TaxID=3694 RepID=A0A2K1YR18_POPTR